jgi:hypothetical protein
LWSAWCNSAGVVAIDPGRCRVSTLQQPADIPEEHPPTEVGPPGDHRLRDARRRPHRDGRRKLHKSAVRRGSRDNGGAARRQHRPLRCASYPRRLGCFGFRRSRVPVRKVRIHLPPARSQQRTLWLPGASHAGGTQSSNPLCSQRRVSCEPDFLGSEAITATANRCLAERAGSTERFGEVLGVSRVRQRVCGHINPH